MSDHIIEFNPAPVNARDPSSTDTNNTSKVIIAEVSYLFIEIWFYCNSVVLNLSMSMYFLYKYNKNFYTIDMSLYELLVYKQ